MLVVVAPVLHFKLPIVQALAVNVTFSVPHTEPPPVTNGAVGVCRFCIVIACELALVPHSVVQVAVYVPDSDTWIVRPVPSPPDQVTVPLHPLAVNVAFSVPHIVVLLAAIVGATGEGFVPITIVLDVPEVPKLVVHVAV